MKYYINNSIWMQHIPTVVLYWRHAFFVFIFRSIHDAMRERFDPCPNPFWPKLRVLIGSSRRVLCPPSCGVFASAFPWRLYISGIAASIKQQQIFSDIRWDTPPSGIHFFHFSKRPPLSNCNLSRTSNSTSWNILHSSSELSLRSRSFTPLLSRGLLRWSLRRSWFAAMQYIMFHVAVRILWSWNHDRTRVQSPSLARPSIKAKGRQRTRDILNISTRINFIDEYNMIYFLISCRSFGIEEMIIIFIILVFSIAIIWY